MRSHNKKIDNSKAVRQFTGFNYDNNQGGDQKDFYHETILSLEEHLAIPTFIRQGKLLTYSHGVKS